MIYPLLSAKKNGFMKISFGASVFIWDIRPENINI